MIHRSRWLQGIVLAIGLVPLSGCGQPAQEERAGQPSAAASASGSAESADVVDLAHIFPPGEGRDLVLENCQNCHTFVPIVVLQMDKDAWHRNSLDHRERVTTLTDEQFNTVYTYLSSNFGPDRPVPTLPKDLLKTWTGY